MIISTKKLGLGLYLFYYFQGLGLGIGNIWGWGQVAFWGGAKIVEDKLIEWEKMSIFIKDPKILVFYEIFQWEKVKFLIFFPDWLFQL